MVLTTERPTGTFRVDPQTVASAPGILELSFTKIINPAKVPFGIFVYLAPTPRDDDRILVGNISVYPPDQPGKFLLRSSAAFQRLRARKNLAEEVKLLIEMKALDENEKINSPIEVSVAPPVWRSDQGQ